MRLRDLSRWDTIVVQCHDAPDADAIASGWALYVWAKHMGKRVRFVYGGRDAIRKADLALMIETLRIPIEHVAGLDETPDLLITVDCQYGERNVTRLEGRHVAIIDHHRPAPNGPAHALAEIRPQYGSCSTLVWSMLLDEGLDVNECDASRFAFGPGKGDRRLATALYHGLYKDTMKMQEIFHPRDKDMRDALKISPSQIYMFQNSDLSLDELKIAARALGAPRWDARHRFATVHVEPCDPNILGIISDMMIEVDAIDTCAVFCQLGDGVKLSVRSCVRTTRADELVREIARGVGDGGGHRRKAGGRLNGELLRAACGDAPDDLGVCAEAFIAARMAEYFEGTVVMDASDDVPELLDAPLYRKLPVPAGYAWTTDVCPTGTELLVRTLEGDFEVVADEGLAIMIGATGEIWPIKADALRQKYDLSDAPYDIFAGEYPPTLRDGATGEAWELLPRAKRCVAKDDGAALVHALRLDRRTKVFTAWSEDEYMLGLPGDMLVASPSRSEDKYVVRGDIFERTYRLGP